MMRFSARLDFLQQLLQRLTNKVYLCVYACVCVCVCACVSGVFAAEWSGVGMTEEVGATVDRVWSKGREEEGSDD